MTCLVLLEYNGDNKDDTALDIDLSSEDVPSLIHVSPFTPTKRSPVEKHR